MRHPPCSSYASSTPSPTRLDAIGSVATRAPRRELHRLDANRRACARLSDLRGWMDKRPRSQPFELQRTRRRRVQRPPRRMGSGYGGGRWEPGARTRRRLHVPGGAETPAGRALGRSTVVGVAYADSRRRPWSGRCGSTVIDVETVSLVPSAATAVAVTWNAPLLRYV